MKEQIKQYMQAECPWRDTLLWYEHIDSTNIKAAQLARSGAPGGTAVLASCQSAGKGRMGRSFSSPQGMGVYLSLILRPDCAPQELMHLTCAVAVAMCRAVEDVSGIRPGIKWINDLVIGKHKLGGILTELAFRADGSVDYAIIGVGINCRQQPQDFPEELRTIATSLAMATGQDVSPAQLAAAMLNRLYEMDAQLLTHKANWMQAYKENCITLGQAVMLSRADTVRYGTALDLDESGQLLVQLQDGTREWVCSGEASVRGMYGYV